jgi:glutamate-1-semialdehyde 2,1-aminomutase
VVLPFNHPEAAERILREEAGQLAAVILEPIIGSGGVIASTHEFLERLRSVTHELGMLLIFDEVISLRVAPGGAQQLYGITPDLTTMGKIIGGGLPVAAFGGRADVMELMDPRRDPNLPQGGTYNGNPLGMAAGIAVLKELTPDVYEDLNRKGARVKDQLTEVFASHGMPAQVNGAGSLLAIHFTDIPVTDYRTKATSNEQITHDFFLARLRKIERSRFAGPLDVPSEMIEASIPRAGSTGRRRIHLFEVLDDRGDRLVKAVQIDSVEAHASR